MRQEAVREFASHMGPASNGSSQQPLRIKAGMMEIDAAIATRILAEHLFAGQRNVKPTVVRALTDEMRRGFWTPGMQIHFGRHKTALHLVNGQQRLNAVVKADAKIEFSILISECESEEELKALYWRHDTVTAPRIMRDVLHAAGIAEAQGMTDSDAGKFVAAVKSLVAGLTTSAGTIGHFTAQPEMKSPDRVFEMARPWWQYGRQYIELIRPAPSFNQNLFKRRIVFAAGLVTLKYQNDKAQDFWSGAAADDGLKRHDPRKQLLSWLTSNLCNQERQQAMLRACALTWNAWFEDRSLAIIKANADFKITFLGTPIGRARKG